MDQTRFENANRLWAVGRNEDAAREFHAMAEEADHPDEKAGLLINEHKCYAQIGQLDRAIEIMRQIRALPVQDKLVRMIIDIGDASMMTLIGRNKEGLAMFERVSQLNHGELQNADSRHLYEEIQRRRGFALTDLERYSQAVPVLKEATSFATVSPEGMQSVYLYLGTCYAALSEADSAKEAFLRAIGFGLANKAEADARYRLAVLYFLNRAFAQAKHHLEAVLQMPAEVVSAQLRKDIYQQMSSTCYYLGETEEEQKYSKLAQAS